MELGEKVARTQVKTKPQDVESPSLKALPTTLVEASGLPSSTSRTDKEQPVNELVETELGRRTEDKALAFVPNTPPMPLIVEPQDMGQKKKAPKRKKLTDKVTKGFLDDLKKNFLLPIPYSERNKVKKDIDYFASALLSNREKWINGKGVVDQEVLENIKNTYIHVSGCRDKNLVKQHFDRFLSFVQERVSALAPPDFYPVPEAVQHN